MRVGVIGTGNMGTILIQSFIQGNVLLEDDLFITNRTLGKAVQLQKEFPGIQVLHSPEEIVKNTDLIFICIKPLDIYPLLKKVNHLLTKEQCIVSITSPISVEQLETLCICSCVRAIPSITNRALSGVNLLSFGQNCTKEWKYMITNLLSKIGTPVEINNEITRVASDIVSCGPAFFSYIIQSFIQSAVDTTKISQETANQLAQEMLIGMAALLEQQHYTLPTLQKKVTVKGGITGEGLKVLEASNMKKTFDQLFQSTHQKYYEDLEKIKEQFQTYQV